MSLAYFPMYPDDYEADTAHLTLAEDGAYSRLLRLCWRTHGCSLPADRAWIYRRMRAASDEEKEVVDIVLGEFFTLRDGRFSNARLMKEWLAGNEAHERRVKAGSKGGKSKALKTNEVTPSNAVAKPKQPEPEPEPEPEEESSVANATDGDAVEPVEVSVVSAAVWNAGKPFLASRRVPNPGAMIGRWLKSHSPLALLHAIEAAQRAGTQDPVPYITEALKGNPRHGNRNGVSHVRRDRIERVAARFEAAKRQVAGGSD